MVDGVSGDRNRDVRRNQDIISNRYRVIINNGKIEIGIKAVTNKNITAVGKVYWWFNPGFFPTLPNIW